jgi:hypothetical protein
MFSEIESHLNKTFDKKFIIKIKNEKYNIENIT